MIHLERVQNNFHRRTERMLGFIDRARTSADHTTGDALVAYVAIELQTSLGYVAKSCFLAGMLGGRSANGTRIRAPATHTQLGALQLAASVIKQNPRQVPGRDEPAWHSGDHLARIVASASPANSVDIQAALGVFPEARKAVLAVRNFYAHRAQHTLLVIRTVLLTEYAEVLRGHPSDGLLTPPIAHPQPFLERWVWNYRDIVNTMCGA